MFFAAGLLLEGCSLLAEQDSLQLPHVFTDSAVQFCLVQPDSVLRAWCWSKSQVVGFALLSC